MSEDRSVAGPQQRTMTRNQAVFIGVGAMVGAGIFALLGEAGAIAKSAVWISFLCAGIIAGLQGYSFAHLGKKYASEAGLMGYLSAGYGEGSRVSSIFSWMVWTSTMIVVAMVAVSFGTYAAATITGGQMPFTMVKVMATVIVIAVILLNGLGGAAAVAKTQSIVIRLVIVVLLGLALVTMLTADWSLLAPATYPPVSAIIGSIALTFFAFLGFGVVSFTAKDLKNEADLGPATYIALAIATVTYVSISLGVFGQLTPEQVTAAGPTAIALAAKPVLGMAGYWVVAVTAMLSTAGAVNATTYPVSGLLGSLARTRVFPPLFGAKAGRFSVGLLITGAIILLFVWLFDLSAIASIGSAVALLIFLVISIGHLRIRETTGASAVVLWIAMLTVIVTLIGFAATTLATSPTSLVAFIGLAILAVVVDTIWRAVRDRRD
jgi:amino acid transporter